jgi:4-aminobutyrate aminotransferase-like enzyme
LITDVDGNTFLDATSSFGVMGVGHAHPRVEAAIDRQSSVLVHGMGDVHPSEAKVKLLERIAQFSPIPDSRIILGQNGSDSVEAAMKTARLATGRPGLIAFDGGYHGLTYGALEPTARGFFRDPFEDQRGRFAGHLPFGCDPQIVADALRDHHDVGAVIVEPIQGRGGVRIPPPGWLAHVRDACHAHGALLILDEIFTGWGRTGWWFACKHDKVTPDLICVGKAMGGGMPISACIGGRALMEAAWGSGSTGEARHTFTFLGHPLSCAAACAAIEAIHLDKLVSRSREVGEGLLSALRAMAAQHEDAIVDVRGRGLMIGIEFRNRERVWPIVLAALRRGLIVLPAGDTGNVIEVVPPYVITPEQCTFIVETLDECITRL